MHLAKYCLLFSIVCCCIAGAFAPVQAELVPDTRGQDFYLTFPPNFHNNLDNPFLDIADSLYIFIAATEPTTGQIVYRDRDTNVYTVNYSITDPSKVYTFGIHWKKIELLGFNDSGTPIPYHQSGKIAPQSFHITSSKDVAVYALNRAETTSDAMLVLPTDVLGKSYRVMAYNSDFRGSGETDTPSQFAVVATQDNTSVLIRPTVPVAGVGASVISVVLNAGDSYLLQAMATNGALPDLTGTLVESSAPVAVFAGHQRTHLPIENFSLSSRDHLVEQMPPVDVWGKSYILTPFPQPNGLGGTAEDIYRVLAHESNTEIFVNGVLQIVLGPGQIYEQPLREAALLTASHNVLVAQYKRTSQDGSGISISDPFMIIIPPRKQFLDSYLCINAQAYVDNGIYVQQFMTIICHKDDVETITIDGKKVNPSLFKNVPGTCYMYGWIPTTDGSHRVEGKKPFGLYMYGYGMLDSYGYTGGMAFRKEGQEELVAVSRDTTICTGDSVELFVTGGKSYKWSPSDELDCDTCSRLVVRPEKLTDYIVSFTDDFGCEHHRVVRVDVRPYPEPVVSGDTLVCTGKSVVLHASGGLSYQWFPAAGLSCTDCDSPTATPKKTTTYKVIVSNGGMCFAEDSVTVVVDFAPIEMLPSDTLMCVEDSIAFDLPSGYTYRWAPATGLSCTNCANPIAHPSKTTRYTVTASNNTGCQVTRFVTVTVVNLPIVNITPDLTLCENAPPVRLLAKGGNYYRWSPADGLSCTTCPDPLAHPTKTTTYTVDISITNTCVATTTITITVAPAPITEVSNDTTVCFGSAVPLLASGGTKYVWSPAAELSCTDCPSPLAMPHQSTTYTVVITNAEGCSVTDSVKISVLRLADVSVSPDVEICPGSSASLSAAGGSTYLWSPADGLSCTDCSHPIASPDKTTKYTARITGTSGCSVEQNVVVTVLPNPELVVGADAIICRGQSTELTAAGGTSYLWWPANGLNCTDCAQPTASPIATTRYYVRALNGSCSQIDSVLVTVSPCNVKGEFSSATFPALLLCDSSEHHCTFRNTGDDPITITDWNINGADASSFELRPPAVDLPYTLKAGEEVEFGIVFQPQDVGTLSATLAVDAQDAPAFTQQLAGEGYKRTLSLSLGPNISTSIGDTIPLNIEAICDNWAEAQLTDIKLDISYPAHWLAYSGAVVMAKDLDQSWTVSAQELPNGTAGQRTIYVSLTGKTPLIANGTIATVYIVPFLTNQQVYTPTVSASAPGRDICITSLAEATSIDINLCLPHLRPIYYSGSPYRLEIEGGTTVSGGRVQVRYGVGIQAPSTLELYNCLGQLVQTIDLGTPGAGDYRRDLDMQNMSSGLYIIRYNSGPYSRNIPFLYGTE